MSRASGGADLASQIQALIGTAWDEELECSDTPGTARRCAGCTTSARSLSAVSAVSSGHWVIIGFEYTMMGR